jgi:hypothetical protein
MLIPAAPTFWSQGQSHGLPAAVPAGSPGSVTSNVINTNGLNKGAVGLASTQAGNLTVQRYADGAGQIPLPAAVNGAPTVAIVANTPIAVTWADGTPTGSIVITVTNSSGSTAANLTNLTVNLEP